MQNYQLGDRVFNLTDGNASAEAIGVNMHQLRLGPWQGGSAGEFRRGDEYRVARRELSEKKVYVWPPQRFDDLVVYDSNPQFGDVRLARDHTIDRIDLNFTQLDPQWTENTQLTITITEAVEAPAQDTPIAQYSFHPIVGVNILNIAPIRLLYTKIYEMVVTEDGINRIGAYIDNMKLYSQSSNYLEMDYVPKPKPMLNALSECELEEYSLEALLALAKYHAMKSVDGEDPDNELHYAVYKRELEIAKDEMRDNGPDTEQEFVDQHNMPVRYNRYPGYTDNYGRF